MSTKRAIAIIILAAGRGTRMKSDLHKVLHPVAGRPMLLHLIDSASALEPERIVVVTGAGREQVEAMVTPMGITTVFQADQLGTGHAVLCTKDTLGDFAGDMLILYGDVPLVSADTMGGMLARLHGDDEPATVVLGFRPTDPAAYGRVTTGPDGRIDQMVEYKDATAEQRAVTLCNSGIMAARCKDVFGWLDRVGNDNAAREYYLPDIVMLAGSEGRPSAVIETNPGEVAGVNSRAELAGVEAAWQSVRRDRAMADGATLIAPDTVWFAHDTVIGRDVTVEPHVVFGPGVTVADGAIIHGFSHLEGAHVGKGTSVGPYARLRPGAVLEEGSRVGNFVEIKKATLGRGAKANHLTYLGDAEIGDGANIGAGTITCNYDGFFKYRTKIGAGAFIGSNSALVAPVVIGAGAIVGAGSVVTNDVDTDALALVRPPQVAKQGWAKRFRERMTLMKKQL